MLIKEYRAVLSEYSMNFYDAEKIRRHQQIQFLCINEVGQFFWWLEYGRIPQV